MAIAQWIDSHADQERLWITFEKVDDRPDRFWSLLVSGLEAVVPGHFEASLAAVTAASPDAALVVEALLDDLATLDTPLVIIFDDLHKIRSQLIHDDLAVLLELAPQDLQIVVISRSDPPLPLARWKLRGWLLDIRAPELALSLEETMRLFDLYGTGEATRDEVSIVWKEADGWVGALRLSAMMSGHRGDEWSDGAWSLISESTVVDLLVTEVLEQQPDDIIDFLLRTSIVDHLDEEMSTTLSGRHDAAEVLHNLELGQTVITSRGRGGVEYRYNPLFLEVLRLELRRRHPDLYASLSLAAAELLRARGELSSAVDLLLRAGEDDEAFAFAYDDCYKAHDEGHPDLAAACLDLIPEGRVKISSNRMLVYAFALGTIGRSEAARVWLSRAVDRIASTPEPLTADIVLADVLKLMCSTILGTWPDGIEPGRRALVEIEGGTDVGAPGTRVRANLARALLIEDRHDEATQILSVPTRSGELANLVLAPANLARCAARRGAIELSLNLAADSLAAAEVLGVPTHLGVADAQLARFAAFYERSANTDARAALEHLDALIALHPEAKVYEILAGLSRAQMVAGQGQYLEAAEYIAEIRAQLVKIDHPALARLGFATEARWRIESGDLGMAASLIERLDVDSITTALLRARLEVFARRFECGLELLERAVPTNRRDCLLVAVQRLRATIERGQQAQDLVSEVIALAAPECMARTILEEGPVVTRAVRDAASRVGSLEAEMLSTALGAPVRRTSASSVSIELSEREHAVLRFLPTNLTNREIANECLMSVNTVKTHLKSIYAKLGVSSRADAVRCARGLGLL